MSSARTPFLTLGLAAALTLCGLLVFATSASPEQRQEVCAKYRTESGMSQGYKVEAIVLMGSELNTQTNSYRFRAFSKYAVIFWDPGAASVIELSFAPGGIGLLGTSGQDQQGRQWELSSRTSFC